MDYFEKNINKIILSNAGNRDNIKWNLLTNYFTINNFKVAFSYNIFHNDN